MPLVKPAPAPQRGLMYAFGSDVESICIRERTEESEGMSGAGIVLTLDREDGSSLAVAY